MSGHDFEDPANCAHCNTGMAAERCCCYTDECSVRAERDAAVALGKRLAADLEHTVDEIEQQAVRRTVNDGVPAESWRGQPAYWLGRLRSVLADARKARWLT